MDEKQITTLEKYTELKSYLVQLASRASVFTAPDKDIQKELQKARSFLIDTGKLLRSGYRKKSDEVMGVEKEHLAIIQPHEERLKRLKDEEDQVKEVEYRKSQFEARSKRIASLDMLLTHEQSIAMNDVGFELHYQSLVAVKNDNERRILEEERRNIEAEKNELARKKEIEEAKERTREEERLRAEKEAVYAKEKNERDQKELIDRALHAEEEARLKLVREENERIQREAEETKKLEADAMYQMFLDTNGYVNDGTFKTEKLNGTIFLYKLVGTLEL